MTEDAPRGRGLVTGVLLAILVAAAYHPVLRLPLLGQDTYAAIASSRIASVDDLSGTITERYLDGALMDGDVPVGLWRPVMNLFLAADHALWGLQPFGWQLVNVLALLACALGLAALARRLLGPAALVGPLVAGVVLVLFPLHVEDLPVVVRRHGPLSCLFVALAVRAHLAPRRLATMTPCWSGALFTLLAMGTKETGVIALPLAFAALWLEGADRGWNERGARALRAVAPSIAAVALLLAGRFAVLGGLGGLPGAGLDNLSPSRGRALLERLVLAGADDHPGGLGAGLATWLVVGAVTIPFLAAATTLLRRDEPGAGGRERRALGVAAAWLVGAGLLALWSGPIYSWRTFSVLVGFALTLGVSAEIALGALARGPGAARVLGAATAAPLFLLAGVELSGSAFATGRARWEEAGGAFTAWQEEVRAEIGDAAPGAVLLLPPPPRDWLALHSIRAWVALEWPEREIEVVRARRPADVPIATGATGTGGTGRPGLTLVLRAW